VTHQYTILTGGRILISGEPESGPRPGQGSVDPPTAIAWTEDTVLAVGADAAVRAVSRGDSRFHDLAGAIVRPLGTGPLEPGAPADFAVLDGTSDPSDGPRQIAVVRGGRVVEGRLP
jgi:predicted amidohydrolase YtcJ